MAPGPALLERTGSRRQRRRSIISWSSLNNVNRLNFRPKPDEKPERAKRSSGVSKGVLLSVRSSSLYLTADWSSAVCSCGRPILRNYRVNAYLLWYSIQVIVTMDQRYMRYNMDFSSMKLLAAVVDQAQGRQEFHQVVLHGPLSLIE